MEEDKVKRWKQRTNWSDSNKPSVSIEDNNYNGTQRQHKICRFTITNYREKKVFNFWHKDFDVGEGDVGRCIEGEISSYWA